MTYDPTTHWRELAEHVAWAKRSDPMARVSIVTPHGYSARDISSYLAASEYFPLGLINVHVMTVKGLGQLLAQHRTSFDNRPEAGVLQREAAVRRVLRDEPGIFAELGSSRHTVRALASSSAVLDGVSVPSGAEDLSQLVADVLRVDRGARQLLQEHWATSDQVLGAAMEMLEDTELLATVAGSILIFLPGPMVHPAEQQLLDAIRAKPATAVIDWSQDATDSEQLLEKAEVFSAPSSDDEARAIVRMVATEVHSGVPGHRIGVFFGTDDPYRTLLFRYLKQAGISVSGCHPRQLKDQATAHYLLSFLALDEESSLDPVLVLDALAAQALSNPGVLPPLGVIERSYRRVRFDASEDEPETLSLDDGSQKRDLEIRDQFLGYITTITKEIRSIQAANDWGEATEKLTAFVETHMLQTSNASRVEDLQGISSEKWTEKLFDAINTLQSLDHVADGPTPVSLVDQLEQAIALAPVERAPVGRGVLVGQLNEAIGRDLDVVIVCGLVEGVLPARFSPDPLLPDEFCGAVGGVVASARDQAKRQREKFFLALASAAQRIVLTYPRGDLRGAGNRVPSRWLSHLMDSRGRLQGVSHIESLQSGFLHGDPVASHYSPSLLEHRIRFAAARGQAPLAGLDATGVERLEATRQMISDRLAGVFSRFNGNLTSWAGDDLLADGLLMSPTSLERYASSPLSFFLQDILGAKSLADLVIAAEIDALQRGLLVHEVLEEWVARHPDRGEDDGETLERLCRERAEIYRQRYGAFWVEVFHDKSVERIVQELRQWLSDHYQRLDDGWSVEATERSFGRVGHGTNEEVLERVSVSITDDVAVEFSGQVDRIDRGGSGELAVVDYKTGSQKTLRGISQSQPTLGRTKFQLGVYGLLARGLGGSQSGVDTVTASYWFIQNLAPKARAHPSDSFISLDLDDQVFDQINSDLQEVLLLIRRGFFPPRPGNPLVDRFTKLQGKTTLETLWGKLESLPELEDFISVFENDGSLTEGES